MELHVQFILRFVLSHSSRKPELTARAPIYSVIRASITTPPTGDVSRLISGNFCRGALHAIVSDGL